jgi:hypothetical protein
MALLVLVVDLFGILSVVLIINETPILFSSGTVLVEKLVNFVIVFLKRLLHPFDSDKFKLAASKKISSEIFLIIQSCFKNIILIKVAIDEIIILPIRFIA